MDLTVQHLRSFLAVADELNFTRAAGRLHVAPSTVSEQIATLEQRLGVTLFHRTSRSVACTEAATALLPLARQAVDGMDKVVAWAAGPDVVSQVAVGVLGSSGRFRDLLGQAREDLPGVDWRIRQLELVPPFDALRKRELDGALVVALQPADRVDGIVSHDLWTERLLVAVREDSALTQHPHARMADLHDQTLICGPRGHENRQWFGTIQALVPGEPRLLPTANNLEEAVEMSAAGIGVTVVSESVMEMFARPGLAFVPLADAPTATVRLHVRAGDPSRALAHFVDLARERHQAR